MTKKLIVLSHSFRSNSRIFRKALEEPCELAVVYPSPWYWNQKERSLYQKKSDSFHRKSINHFAESLRKDFNLSLHVLKSRDPVQEIETFCRNEQVETLYYDLPLFRKDCLEFSFSETVEVDSDSYDPECARMTAKSRWTYWTQNRHVVKRVSTQAVKSFPCLGTPFSPDVDLYKETSEQIQSAWSRLQAKLITYFLSRNERDGSTQLSRYLHHGLIDAPSLTSDILSLDPGFLGKGNPLVPILRQLAFREICIRKARTRDLSLTSTAQEWASALLDEKSYKNLTDSKHPQKFSKRGLFCGDTGNKRLDEEIALCKKKRWMPNRARMWFAGEVYWGIGGGIESLETLVEFFDTFCDDAQSPNNWVSCVESMRMQYGKVMKFNEKRTFRLLTGEERI